VIEAIKRSGISTLAGVAEALNARGLRSARGGKWHVSAAGLASGPAFGTVRSETESDHAPTSRAIEWVTGESFTNRTVFAAPKATPIATPAATTTIAAITTGIFCLGGGDSGGEDCRFEIGTAASRLARYKASYSVKSMNKPPVDSLNVRL